MKRIWLLLIFASLCLTSCGTEQKESDQKSIEDMPTNMNVQIVSDYSKELIVPNPESSEENTIVMRYIPNFEKYEAFGEMDRCYKSCDVDLSFLEFKNKMTILAFQIGAVTNYTSAYTHIEYDIPDDYQYKDELPVLKDRKISGNCLVLVAKDSLNEDDYNYIIVLDYEKKKNYIVKTSIWNPTNDHIPVLQLCDLTGDGVMDIVISNSLNENDVNMQIFTFSENKIKTIYSNTGGEEKDEDNAISGYLADDYKIVFECESMGLKKTKSLLKLGYSEKQLRDNYDENGKAKKGSDIQIDLAQDMEICKKNEYDYVISYRRMVTFTKYNRICDIYVYLKYDTKKDKMDIYDINIK